MKFKIMLFLALLGITKIYAQQADAINGVWQMPDNKIKIKIKSNGELYQGKLIKASVNSPFNLDLPVG